MFNSDKWNNIGIATGITFMAILFFAGGAGATPVEEWNKTFAGGLDEYDVSFIQQTSDGGYIFVGSINDKSDTVNHHKYAWVVKIDSKGNEQWSRKFTGEYSDYTARISDPVSGERTISGKESTAYANAVQQISGGGYMIVGGYWTGGGSAEVIWLINIDSNGNEKWNKTFGGKSTDDKAYSFEQTSDRGYIITGSTKGDNFWKDAWLIKTDANGNEQWNKKFGGSRNDETYSVKQTPDGGYILSGYTQSYGGKGWVIKTDAKGDEQWNKTLAYPLKFINQTSDGGYMLAGSTSWGKIDASGNELWNKPFNKTEKDTVLFFKQTSDNGYLLTGQTSGSSNEKGFYEYYTDSWLSNIDENGNEKWKFTFRKSGGTFVSTEKTSDGGYILAGNQLISGKGSEAWLMKLSKDPSEITDAPIENTDMSTTEKVAGFEVVLTIITLSAIYFMGRKRR